MREGEIESSLETGTIVFQCVHVEVEVEAGLVVDTAQLTILAITNI